MASMTPLKRSPHALRWVRETLDLTQAEMASVLGAGEQTVRAVESGRLKFSRKFATRLAEQTGLDAERLMQNELDPAPSPIEVRTHFSQAQKGDTAGADFSPGGRVSEILPRALILRAYVIQRLIVDELGYSGCHHTGFFDKLQKMNAKLLWSIPHARRRQKVFQHANDILAGGTGELVKFVASDLQGLREVTAAADRNCVKSRASIRNRMQQKATRAPFTNE
jgi:DNA-binding XRE family transcriptional regulator